MSKVPLQAVPGFLAAARLLNLSRAAASMHITVSALSHQMTGLEKQLRTRLLDRGPRGVKLTAAGERLYSEIAAPYGAIERALRMPAVRNERSLRVDAIPWFASSWLIPRLPKFVATFPDVELSLSVSYDFVDFGLGEHDATLRYGAGGWEGLNADRLFDETLVPVATPRLREIHARDDRSDLGRWPLLGGPNNYWQKWFERYKGDMPKRFVARFDSSETLVRGATEGLGVALVPLTLAEPLIRARRIVRVSAGRLPAGLAHYLVYPPRTIAHEPFQRFRSWLLQTIARNRQPSA